MMTFAEYSQRLVELIRRYILLCSLAKHFFCAYVETMDVLNGFVARHFEYQAIYSAEARYLPDRILNVGRRRTQSGFLATPIKGIDDAAELCIKIVQVR